MSMREEIAVWTNLTEPRVRVRGAAAPPGANSALGQPERGGLGELLLLGALLRFAPGWALMIKSQGQRGEIQLSATDRCRPERVVTVGLALGTGSKSGR